MKKLLVTAIGAAAAFGAIAGEISRQAIGEFDSTGPVTTNELNQTLGNYWSELSGSTNTYTVSELASVGTIDTPISPISGKALDVKTTFGKPLSVDIVAGGTPTNIPNSGIYFDSLVKFTVCEDTPADTYDGAKIIMWLQEQYEGDNVTGTNLWVRAGYLTTPGNVVETNYLCGTTIDSDFADKWHRITIKAMADITVNGGLGHTPVPGFAIFIDSTRTVISDESKWAWADGAYPLTEAAEHYGESALFPSMIQDQQDGNKGSLTCASFDGTGSLTDIVFTDDAPIDIAEDYVAPKAVITVDGVPYGSETGEYTDLASAIEALNGITASKAVEVEFTLQKDVAFDGDLTINNIDEDVTIVIDLDGKTLTADEIILKSPVTITDSNVAKTGVIVADIYVDRNDAAGEMTLLAGTIDGYIEGTLEEDVPVYKASVFLMGGTVAQDDIDPVAGYVLEAVPGTEFFNVVEYVAPTYTVKFISGEGSTTNEYTKVEGETITAPEPAAVTGKSFQAWDPAVVVSPVVANATYTALYTNNIYTITFVIGEDSSTVQKEYGSEITSVPEIPVRSGYTGAWDDDPAGDTVTGDKTYTYTYSAETYTITYMYGANALTGLTPATYTVENAVTLPTEVDLGVTGVTFESWTNAEGTVVADWAAGAKTGNQTFYAKTEVPGSVSFDGGGDNTFTIDAGAQATVKAATGCQQLTDTVAGSTLTYAQAYALGLIDNSGDVAELDATIEMKDGKVVVGLSSTPLEAYTITLKVYEKASLTAAWPTEPTQTYTLDDTEATTGFTPGSAGAGFYKTEITISNK